MTGKPVLDEGDWCAAYHEPVLVARVVEALVGEERRLIVDGTIGTGGHTLALLEADETVRVLGLDRDRASLKVAERRLDKFSDRITLIHRSYAEVGEALKEVGWEGADGILLDLGVSTFQLAGRGRGFSFQREEPLDCRFDPTSGDPPACELLQQLSERELAELINRFGEERGARRIARAIKEKKPRTTLQLAELVCRVKGRDPEQPGTRIHPATKTFQALRIAVNRELEHLEAFLRRFAAYLRPGGRCAVISYHSLEDRLVKRTFSALKAEGVGEVITRRPVRPAAEEVARNPRSRSARLRVFERAGRRACAGSTGGKL